MGDLWAQDSGRSPSTILWGTSLTGGGSGGGTVFKLVGGSLERVWNFTGGSDGSFPLGGLTADKAGVLYGTTSGGGTNGNGTVFKIDRIQGTLTTIWRFSGSDGSSPQGNLLVDESGALYGTTSSGGIHNSAVCYSGTGCGTVFKLIPPLRGQSSWTLTTLHYFTGGADGGNPYTAGVIADKNGALYGTTWLGGTSNPLCDPIGCGVVFKLSPPSRAGQTPWTETVLWGFSGYGDGDNPQGPVIADRKGALYGTTSFGGISCPVYGIYGCGVVFKLTPPASGQTAWAEATLWSFTGGSDGSTPFAGLAADNNGALYGTTENGGDVSNPNSPPCYTAGCGVVFKLTGTGFAPGGEQDAEVAE
ncbi:MAG: choice-of-anchor tandem repeat GloVer-containing protein [Stellaceae bacterium]